MERKCKICKTIVVGRPDKIFCSTKCKNYYHKALRKVTDLQTTEIDKILHRNRSILLEIIGKNTTQKKVPRLVLEKKKFRFKYLTHFHINSMGKTFHFIYDLAWMEFSNDDVLIIRKRQ